MVRDKGRLTYGGTGACGSAAACQYGTLDCSLVSSGSRRLPIILNIYLLQPVAHSCMDELKSFSLATQTSGKPVTCHLYLISCPCPRPAVSFYSYFIHPHKKGSFLLSILAPVRSTLSFKCPPAAPYKDLTHALPSISTRESKNSNIFNIKKCIFNIRI